MSIGVSNCKECGRLFWSGGDQVCGTCHFNKVGEREAAAEQARLETERKRLEGLATTHQPARIAVPGYVYVMKSAGRYKIGMTSRKSGRLDEIKRLVPVLELVWQIACDDAGAVETYLHKKYKKQRITHEWYRLTKEDLEWFKSLKDHDLDELVA